MRKMAINATLKEALHQTITSFSNYGLTIRKPSDISWIVLTRVGFTNKDQRGYPAFSSIKCFYPYK